MTSTAKQHIFLVDDEPAVLKAVSKTLGQLGTKVSCFTRAADCLERLRCESCDLLITDVKLPGIDGLELLTEAKRIAPWLPVLLVTGYGSILMAVKAINMGAADYIEKPLDKQRLLSAVKALLKQNAQRRLLMDEGLTRAEIKVLRLILEGKSNREAANLLHRSVKTVETHRSHIMRKLDVDNVVDLVKRAVAMGLVDPPTGKSP
jgi:FixJ family two-component response regulator